MSARGQETDGPTGQLQEEQREDWEYLREDLGHLHTQVRELHDQLHDIMDTVERVFAHDESDSLLRYGSRPYRE